MTKAEELKLLEQIDALIASAGKDSYIAMTFAGVPELCKRNIELDFGDSPVQDLAIERERLSAEVVRHDETKHQLSDAQKSWKEAMNEIESLKSQVRNLGQDSANLAEERDAIAECVDGLQEIIDKQDGEIRKLKAEIVKLRMERMTEEEIAELYDKTEGGN